MEYNYNNNLNENIYQIKNLKFNPFTPSKKLVINPETPFSTGKLSTNYTNKYIKMNNRYIFQSIYKTFHKDLNIINNNINYYSLATNPNPNKIRHKFINKSTQKNFKPKKVLLLSLFKTPKKINKKILNKDNFIFIPKKYEIINLHSNLMEKNKMSLKLNQEKEIKKNLFNDIQILKEKENIKNRNICLTNESMPLFDKEYNDEKYKSKSKEKKIILKEINNIGKKLSFSNLKKLDDIIKNKDINNTHSVKRVKEKESLLEINQISNLPALAKDNNMVFDLWKKDMMRYCKLTLDMKNKNNENFVKNLLCVYN